MTTQSDVRPLIGRRALIGGALAGAAGLVVVPHQVSAEGGTTIVKLNTLLLCC